MPETAPPVYLRRRGILDEATERLALRAALSASHLLGLATGTHLRKLRAQNDPLAELQARLEEAELRARLAGETAEILGARFSKLPERHRPYFTPAQRFRLLEMRSLLAWSAQETARVFLVCPNTILNWEKAADAETHSVGCIVKPTPPIRRAADVVRSTIQAMTRDARGKDPLQCRSTSSTSIPPTGATPSCNPPRSPTTSKASTRAPPSAGIGLPASTSVDPPGPSHPNLHRPGAPSAGRLPPTTRIKLPSPAYPRARLGPSTAEGSCMEAPDPRDDGPDTKTDKTLRFGCGTLLGALVVLSVLPYSDVFGQQVYTLFGIVIPLTCGLLALFQGKRFLLELLDFIRGLAKWV